MTVFRINPPSPSIRHFDGLLRWVLLIAAIGFAGVILWDYGFINYLLTNDSSRLSLIIIVLFAAFSIYCLWMLVNYSRELAAVEATTTALHTGAELSVAPRGAELGGRAVPRGLLVGDFLDDVAIRLERDPDGNLDILLDSFAAELRVPGRRGIFVADVMYKLGMLGTVIGFIAMLVSLRDLGDFEIAQMRAALQQMTAGMAVALLTTVTGLVCGVLLRLQFNILDAAALRILRRTVRLTELFLRSARSAD
jgi:hypothetical protein